MVQHFGYIVHASVQILTLYTLRAHTVIGVEQLYGSGQIIVHELFYLRDIVRVSNCILGNFICDAHQLIYLLPYVLVLDGRIDACHLSQSPVTFFQYGIYLRAVALFLLGGLPALGRLLDVRLIFILLGTAADKIGGETCQDNSYNHSPYPVQRQYAGGQKPYSGKGIVRQDVFFPFSCVPS